MSQDVKITKAEIKFTPIKKTISRNKENRTPAKVKTSSSFTILPELKVAKLNIENLEECNTAIDKIIKVLKLRQLKSKPLEKDNDTRQAEVRKRLVDFNQDYILSKAEMKSLKTVINKEKQKSRNLQLKMSDLETMNQDMRCKNDELESIIITLKNTINEKNVKINQNILEKEKTKQKIGMCSLYHFIPYNINCMN